MKLRRMMTGLGLLFSSALISTIIAKIWGTTAIGSIAVASIVAFIGGCWFMSGKRKVRMK
jgi:hypothetical protein